MRKTALIPGKWDNGMTADERLEFLLQSNELHDREISGLTANIADLTTNVALLVGVTNRNAEAIGALARTAEVMTGGPPICKADWTAMDSAPYRASGSFGTASGEIRRNGV